MRTLCVFICLFLLNLFTVKGQTNPLQAVDARDSLPKIDTVKKAVDLIKLEADTLVSYSEKKADTAIIASPKLHSPHKATIYEALLPGLGHVYNKKAWHIPITYAAFGTAVFFIMDNTKKYKKYRNAYEDFSHYKTYLTQGALYPISAEEPSSQRFRKVRDVDYTLYSSPQLESFSNALKNNKDSFRRYRDLSYIGLAAVYVLNVIWAATDAHFFYYDVSDDLSLDIQPQFIVNEECKQSVGMSLVLHF